MDIVDADLGIAAVSTPLAGLGVPELPESVGLPYLVGPEEPYSVAQWVWLPLPEGTAPGDVALWYYHPATLDAGWYAADRVEGWLASEEFSVREFHGTVYLGFLVRHGGVAQLATQDAEVQVSASAAVLPGDIIILVFCHHDAGCPGKTGPSSLHKAKETSRLRGHLESAKARPTRCRSFMACGNNGCGPRKPVACSPANWSMYYESFQSA